MVTTAFGIDGFKVTKNLGIVRGITVRSRSIVGNIGAGLQTIFGGRITIYQELCEQSREEAFELLVAHASQMAQTPSSGCDTTLMRLRRGSPKFSPMAPQLCWKKPSKCSTMAGETLPPSIYLKRKILIKLLWILKAAVSLSLVAGD